jgi:uncharacterized protein YdiU (UPF0061 family)
MLREVLISEAMHALGIPTTRSLAVVSTGETIWRQEVLPGAILTRVAASHLRVGTAEFAAARQDLPALRSLAHYIAQRHYPDLAPGDTLALYHSILQRHARLIAQWQCIGFVHGVMNTDNVALSGETIDYGPCAFLDHYDPSISFSSIDHHGRYAFGRQPQIGQWNMARLGEAMMPLFAEDEARSAALANEALQRFPTLYEEAWLEGMRRKLGLFHAEAEDLALVKDLLSWMEASEADFTDTFRQLSDPNTEWPDSLSMWLAQWQARRQRQPQSLAESTAVMHQTNPCVIPRNHWVEAALTAATAGDLCLFRSLLAVLKLPFAQTPAHEPFQALPGSRERYVTYCGT